eukprot:298198-Alexandrium_andersonii.AAC.2
MVGVVAVSLGYGAVTLTRLPPPPRPLLASTPKSSRGLCSSGPAPVPRGEASRTEAGAQPAEFEGLL